MKSVLLSLCLLFSLNGNCQEYATELRTYDMKDHGVFTFKVPEYWEELFIPNDESENPGGAVLTYYPENRDGWIIQIGFIAKSKNKFPSSEPEKMKFVDDYREKVSKPRPSGNVTKTSKISSNAFYFNTYDEIPAVKNYTNGMAGFAFYGNMPILFTSQSYLQTEVIELQLRNLVSSVEHSPKHNK